MSKKSNLLKYWISLTLGTFVGTFLGPYLFPAGLTEVHGMGISGNLGLAGIAVLLAIIGFVVFTGTSSTEKGGAFSDTVAS